MADSMIPDERQSARFDARDGPSSTTMKSQSNLYRAPTWARNINFDSSFDLAAQPSPELSAYASPSDGLYGQALGGSPRLGDHQAQESSSSRGQGGSTYLPTNRNGSPIGIPQQPFRSNPHTRQLSNAPITPARNLTSQSTSDRSTPKAPRANVSSMLPNHQRVASASSATGSTDWLRSPMPPQLHSSADLYAAVDNRPGTSMSTPSAQYDDTRDDRLDNVASNGLQKRASVLSFQTARSEALDYDDTLTFTSAPASEMDFLDRALPPKPWLMQPSDAGPNGTTSFNSSVDDRHLPPGGWASAQSWNSGAEEGPSTRRPMSIPNSPRTNSRNVSAERLKSPSLSPRLRLSNLNENPSAQRSVPHTRTSSGSQSLSISPQEQKSARPTSLLRNDTTEELLSAQSLGFISGPSTIDAPLEHKPRNVSPPERTRLPEHTGSNRGTSTLASQQQPGVPSTNATAAAANASQETRPPAVPDKNSPPSIPPKNEVGLSSPPLSDNVIPAPLPVEVASIPIQMPADRAPVADFRRKPLAAMTKDADVDIEATGASTDTIKNRPPQSSDTRQDSSLAGIGAVGVGAIAATSTAPTKAPARVGPGIGAHAARNSGADQTAAPAFAALMRKPSNGSVPRAAVPSMVAPDPVDRSPSPSIDTPPREPSPPPEGEVEARAEWERAQMRQMAEKAKRASHTPRKTTFRGQLKPLQLVTAEDTKRASKSSPKRDSPIQSKSNPDSSLEEMRGGQADVSGPSATTVSRSTSGGSGGLNAMAAAGSPSLLPANGKSGSGGVGSGGGGGMSTQQLQRQLARDQRSSITAVNKAMGQMGVGDIGGAYPVFPSPSISPSNIRQYSGLMPQRSLVPPFELQNRPDGLPSALTGPDGVRRSPNDPEVCLECMMRDEDMIDVHVLGAGLWERESDLDFAEAIRLEGEEDAKRDRAQKGETIPANGAINTTLEKSGSAIGEGLGASTAKEAAATVAVGSLSATYPRLTKIRVKRVAKGEPLTAERLKLHTQMNPPASSHRWRTLQTFLAVQAKYIAMEQKARGIVPPAVPPKSAPKFDNGMIKTMSGESRPSQRHRVASPALFQVEEVPLSAEEQANKEKDIVGAREARRRNNALNNTLASTLTSTQGVVDTTAGAEEAANNGTSGPPVVNDNSSGHNSIPRRSNVAPTAYTRAGSFGDLRSIPSAMAAKKDTLLPLPLSSSSLAPPQAPFRGPSSPTTPRGTRMRSVSSQMSLANSGSMIDMHVGLENSKEHRISQAGFVPGTPLQSQSPNAMNRAFYGFPGDGEADAGEDWSQYRGYDQSMANSFGEYDDGYSGARSSPDLEKRKKKSSGLRGLFTKKSGRDLSEGGPEDDSMDSRRSYKRPDSSMELQPPPGMVGLLSRARRSTSSLLSPSGRQSIDSTMMLGGDRGFSNPLMASQTSLEMGPFGTGPLPPPRKDSRMPQGSDTKEKEKGTSRLRAFSSGNLMGKKKNANPPNPTSRTSSMMQGPVPSTPTNGDRDPYDRSNAPSAMSIRRDMPPATVSREASYGTSPGPPLSSLAYGEGQMPRTPSMQMNGQQEQYRHPMDRRYERSDLLSPDRGGLPERPPRNPERTSISGPSSDHQEYVDGPPQSRSPLYIPASLQKEQYFHSYDAQSQPDAGVARQRGQRNEQQRVSSFGYMGQTVQNAPPSTTPSRTSKLLKLPFGKNKRESAAVSLATTKDTNSLKSGSSKGTFDDNAAYYGAPPRTNGSPYQGPGLDSYRGTDQSRPRYDSNASFEDRSFPSRSQSAMGMFDNNHSPGQGNNSLRGLFPRLRTSSRAALREVSED